MALALNNLKRVGMPLKQKPNQTKNQARIKLLPSSPPAGYKFTAIHCDLTLEQFHLFVF